MLHSPSWRRLRRFALPLTVLPLLAAFVLADHRVGAWLPVAVAAVNVEMPPPSASNGGSLRYRPDAPQLAAIQVASVRRGALPAGRPVNGRVVYDEDVTVRVTAAASGRVMSVSGKLGAHVGRGGVLAVLDSPDVASAQSDLAKAVADERHKRETLARVTDLAASDTVPAKDLEAARADVLSASAETARAAQKLRNFGANVEGDGSASGRYALRAPIAGTIVDRQINDGMEVRPDLAAPLYTVTDPQRLWVLADIPDEALARVHPGLPVRVRSDAWPGIEFDGIVDAIPAAVDTGLRRVQVRCRLRNPGGRLKAEMYVRVAFLADGQRNAFEVPNAALVLQGSRQLVIVETAPGVFARRTVAVGASGPDSSFVTDGLADGDKVVTEGALLLLGEFPAQSR